MDPAVIVALIALFGSGGGLGAFFLLRPQIRKLRAETNKSRIDAAVAEDSAEDEHLKTVVEFVVGPLKREVTELRTEVASLREEVRTVRKKYYKLLDWARDVRTWARVWPAEDRPPLPTLPTEVLDDI